MADKSLKKIDESDLQEISGGYIFDTKQLCPNPVWEERYEIIDSKGRVVGTTGTPYVAEMKANQMGENTIYLNWEQLQRLRETGSPD